MTAAEAGIDTCYSDDSGREEPIGASGRVYPAFRAMPMGWSWRLWFCQGALTQEMVSSEVHRAETSEADVRAGILSDVSYLPRLRPGSRY